MLFDALRDLIQQDSADDKILSYFEERKPHLTQYDESNHSALYYLLKSDYAHLVTQLIKKHPSIVSIYAVKEVDVTPLYIAAEKGHIEVVNALLAAGADKDKAKNDTGSTPLYIAAQNGHIKVVKALLAAGADKDKARSDTGATPLYVAARKGHIKVVKALLAAGADIDKARSDIGTTPLYIAAEKGHIKVVKALLEAGADISLAYRNNRTLLHHASINKQSEIVKVLAAHPSTTLEVLQACENDTHITSQIKDILSKAIQERMDFVESNPVCQTALEFWPKCPISLQYITDPVMAEDGHTYERAFIERWLQTNNQSPQTRQSFRANTLIKNFQALDAINRVRKVIDSAYKEHKTPKPPAASPSQQVGVLTRSSSPSFFTSERTSRDQEQQKSKSTKGDDEERGARVKRGKPNNNLLDT